MTASITGRKRCGCGQYKTPLANGTMPRHTRPARTALGVLDAVRVHCEGSGQFPTSDKRSSKNKSAPAKSRGGKRASKVGTKNALRNRRRGVL